MKDRPIRWRKYQDAANSWAVAEGQAAPGLAGAVHGYSYYDEQVRSFTTRREMPGTRAVLIVNFADTVHLTGGDGHSVAVGAGQGFIAGLHARPALSRTENGLQRGIHVFLPLATLRRLFRLDMADLTDRVVTLSSIEGAPAQAVTHSLVEASPEDCFDLLDGWLANRLVDAPAPDRAVDWAIARLNADPAARIDALADDIGWSRKHLSVRFRAVTGASPRAYARIRRFERLLRCVSRGITPHWADLAAAYGFADQPHLAREVRDLSGLTPTMLQKRLLPAGGGVFEE